MHLMLKIIKTEYNSNRHFITTINIINIKKKVDNDKNNNIITID